MIKKTKKLSINKVDNKLLKNNSKLKNSSKLLENNGGEKSLEKNGKEKNFKFIDFMNDFAQALVITSIFLLLCISFLIVGAQKRIEKVNKNDDRGYINILDDVRIVKKQKGFFGNLNFSLGSTNAESGENLSMSFSDKMTSSETIGFGEIEKMISSSMGTMPYEPHQYNYIYTGGEFSLFPEEVEVYKRINLDLSEEFISGVSDFKIPFVDIKKFNNIGVHNLTINENKDYGYSIYLGLKDGSFSLYKNWEKWPSVDKICASRAGYDNDCYQNYQLTINDVLSDQEIIKISDNFLKNYGISLKNFGSAEVQKYWMRDYVLNEDKASFYIPDTISVIYPLKLNGKNVYEEYGEKSGLIVKVDMREKRVASVYNLFYQYYESSSYSTERDKDVILKMVEQSGDNFYPVLFDSNDSQEDDFAGKTIDIEVGKPSLEMVKVWHYDYSNMNGYEIYVPAYIFPIVSESEPSYFSKKNIVIPAVKDFFRQPNIIMEDNTLPVLMKPGSRTEPSSMEPFIGVNDSN